MGGFKSPKRITRTELNVQTELDSVHVRVMGSSNVISVHGIYVKQHSDIYQNLITVWVHTRQSCIPGVKIGKEMKKRNAKKHYIFENTLQPFQIFGDGKQRTKTPSSEKLKRYLARSSTVVNLSTKM